MTHSNNTCSTYLDCLKYIHIFLFVYSKKRTDAPSQVILIQQYVSLLLKSAALAMMSICFKISSALQSPEQEWSEDEFSDTYLPENSPQSQANKSRDHYSFNSPSR